MEDIGEQRLVPGLRDSYGGVQAVPGGLEPEVLIALAAALDAGAGLPARPVFSSEASWTRLPGGWPGDVFFVDASAATARAPGGEASLVKLAVLHRHGAGEGLYAPSVPGAPPVLYVPEAGERVRQALVYVVELAQLLSLAHLESVGGREVGGERILVRHGPLVQQLSHYMAPVYAVEEDVAEAALLYAGLGQPLVSRLLRGSRLCGSPGRVSLGLLALRLLEEMARVAEEHRGRVVFAGVVEDTSRSRLLAASLLAEALQALVAGAAPVTVQQLGHLLVSTLSRWVAAADYGCLAAVGWWPSLSRLSPEAVTRELLAPLNSELQIRFSGGLGAGAVPRLSVLEAAASSSGSMPDITDSELLYSLVYLEAPSCRRGPCAYTRPRSRAAAAEWAARSLQQRSDMLGCHPGLGVEPARRVLYSYLLPEAPPGCRSLASAASRLGISVADAASLVQVPPAVRVEWMTPVEPRLLSGLLSSLYWASRLVAYGYPPQLLVVDKASRVTWWEVASLEQLAEELGRRRQPYRGFLRGWQRRSAAITA